MHPTRPPTNPLSPKPKPPIVEAGMVTGLLVVGMWAQEMADQFMFGTRLDYFGIEPRTAGTFWHVFTAPFLHAGFPHLIANTVPFAVLAFLSAVRSISRFVVATALICLVGGALIWLLARGNSVHLGASELIFGYLAYLLGVGWWERTPVAIGIAVVAVLLYGGIIWGVLPGNPAVSWEAHLFGFIGGLVAALLLHRKRPLKDSARYTQ